MSSVVEVGTSLQSAAAPKLVHVRASGWPSGTRFTSSRPMPSSTIRSRSSPRHPSGDAFSHAESGLHVGDALGANASDSVSLVGADPVVVASGEPSKSPSRLSRTMAEFEPLTQALAYMSPVAQSSSTLSSNNAKSYSKRSSNEYPGSPRRAYLDGLRWTKSRENQQNWSGRR